MYISSIDGNKYILSPLYDMDYNTVDVTESELKDLLLKRRVVLSSHLSGEF